MESRLGGASHGRISGRDTFPRPRPLERIYRARERNDRADVGELAGGIIFHRDYLHPRPIDTNNNWMGSRDLPVTSSHHARYVISPSLCNSMSIALARRAALSMRPFADIQGSIASRL